MEVRMNSSVGDLASSNGSLFLLGGGMESSIVRRFFDLAGGLEAPVVVIPTALGDEVIREEWTDYQPFEVVIRANPELLGLGLDHDNGVIIRGETLEVIGKSYTTIYDYNRTVQTGYDHEMHFLPEAKFYFLAPGDRFNMRTRQVVENSKTYTESVTIRKWSEL
jgi:hypothetical protein